MNNLIKGMQQNSTVKNTKGGEYYSTTYNSNLDLFSGVSRWQKPNEMIQKFKNALHENTDLALANLLYILDIRNGKGERLIFKTLYKYLCNNEPEQAKRILPFIGELGRWDYVLVGLKTSIHEDTIAVLKKQFNSDLVTQNPSLLGKWLPSRKRAKDEFDIPKVICDEFGITRAKYRKLVSELRKRIGVIEIKLMQKEYSEINFERVPAKAMLRYRKLFAKVCGARYQEYLTKANKGEAKINTNGLFAYEIIKKIKAKGIDEKLANAMWEQQKDVLHGYDGNMLVMADTSGSMTSPEYIPISTAQGLAIYIAERNKGAFKDYYMTFSSRPLLQKVTGKTIVDKVRNMKEIVEDTNIDEAFALLLETAKNQNITQDEMPTHIIIISDMEFDNGRYSYHSGVKSKNGTNFSGWEKAFQDKGYVLPKIIFWQVSRGLGFPVTKFDNDVAMITGFSTSVFENILTIENLTPESVMLNKLLVYLDMLTKDDTNA